MSEPTPRALVAVAWRNAKDPGLTPAQAHDWMDFADALEASVNAQEEGVNGLAFDGMAQGEMRLTLSVGKATGACYLSREMWEAFAEHAGWPPEGRVLSGSAGRRRDASPAAEHPTDNTRWMSVICRDGEVVVRAFPDEGAAWTFFDQAQQQWTESYLCQVVQIGTIRLNDPAAATDLPDVRRASPLFECGPLHHGETLMAGERVLSLTLGGDLLAEVCVAGPYDSTEVMSAIVEAWNAHQVDLHPANEQLRAELRRVTAERDQLFADLTGPGSVTHRNRPCGERTEGRISMFSDEEQVKP